MIKQFVQNTQMIDDCKTFTNIVLQSGEICDILIVVKNADAASAILNGQEGFVI